MAIPQTSVSTLPAVGLAGQIASADPNGIESYEASEAIPAGVLVELSSGKVRRPQQVNGGLGPVVGVSVYKAGMLPGGYAAGDMVPVLRKGKIFAKWTGTTQSALTAPTINHSSTTSTNRGAFTDASASNTAGSEVAAAPEGILLVSDTGSTSLCLVELNLPA